VGLRVVDHRAGRDADFYLPTPRGARHLYYPHPYMGFVLVPGAERSDGFTARTNSLGFRGPDRPAAKPEGTYRIFCLGGSTTYGTGVMGHEGTYPAQLERLLREQAPDGVTYEVWNCGVSGYNTAESLINLQLRLFEFEPDAIVVYHAANDARPVQARGFRPDYAHLRRAWVSTHISSTERFLLRTSRIYAWLARGTDPERQLSALSQYLFVPGYRGRHVPSSVMVNEPGVQVYLRNLRHMVVLARANGVEPVLSTFAICPSKKRPGMEDFDATIRAMNEGVRALAAEEGVALVEVAERLDDREDMYTDWVHFNDAGSLEHARIIAEQALEQGLFLP
jgi:lysophospholipase L1-like esterase